MTTIFFYGSLCLIGLCTAIGIAALVIFRKQICLELGTEANSSFAKGFVIAMSLVSPFLLLRDPGRTLSLCWLYAFFLWRRFFPATRRESDCEEGHRLMRIAELR